MTKIRRDYFDGFFATAVGALVGITTDSLLPGTANMLAASVVGGVAGSALGWWTLRSRWQPVRRAAARSLAE